MITCDGMILKRYCARIALVFLYSIFFATQLLSVTPDGGSPASSTFPSLSYHQFSHSKTIAPGIHHSIPFFSHKKVPGFRLNKRFQPTEWAFICVQPLESSTTYFPDASTVFISYEADLSTTQILHEKRRGPPVA